MIGDDQGIAPSDEQLVLRMAAGDEQALAELYRRYAPHLTALARHMLRDPAEADASVQTAFAQAWKTAGHFEAQKLQAKTWLFILSHRLFRHQVRERDLAPGEDPALLLETGNGAEENPNLLRRVVVVEPRELLAYAFFQGYTEQKLANLTGQPLAEIRQTLRTTLAQLSRVIKEREP